jgi:hypothetical protein
MTDHDHHAHQREAPDHVHDHDRGAHEHVGPHLEGHRVHTHDAKTHRHPHGNARRPGFLARLFGASG